MAVTASGSVAVTFGSDTEVTGGSTIHWPLAKMAYGSADTNLRVTTAQPLPVRIESQSATINISLRELSSNLKLQTVGVVSATINVAVLSAASAIRFQTVANSNFLTDSGGTAISAKHAIINATASGTVTIVGNVASKRIRVIAANWVSNVAQQSHFRALSSGATLTGRYEIATNGGVVLPANQWGHFLDTSAGEGLCIFSDQTGTVGGTITYLELD